MALVDQLKKNSGRIWTDATNHPFISELGDGSLAEDKFRRYFIQDYVFVNQLAKVGGLGGCQGAGPGIGQTVRGLPFDAAWRGGLTVPGRLRDS